MDDWNKATEGSDAWSTCDYNYDNKSSYNMKLEKDFSKNDFLSGSTLHFILNLKKEPFISRTQRRK